MNKYIRTDREIFEPQDFQKCTIEDEKVYIFGRYLGKFVAQSDNLKELCDKFVYTNKFNQKCFCTLDKEKNRWIDRRYVFPLDLTEDEVKTIKGAIWTAKGLIFMTEMTDEGGFRLICNY